MTAHPTGRAVGRDVVFVRTFQAPIDDVWAAITESDRLARWIGYYEGDPAAGSVQLFMTAEGEGPAETVMIDECEPPRLLAVTQGAGPDGWRLRADLTQSGGTTTLTFTHLALAADALEMVGPGWDYYLDRLVAAEGGGDVDGIDFEKDYYPAMAEHYRSEAAKL